MRVATTNATQTEATTDGSTGRVVLPNLSTYNFRGQITARASTSGDSGGWQISGTIKRGSGAAATAIVGTVAVSAGDLDSGASAWAVAVDADTTNGALRVRVTGAASTNIHWVCTIDTAETTW